MVVSDHLGFTFWKVAYGRFNCSQINTVVGGGGGVQKWCKKSQLGDYLYYSKI